MGPMSRSARHYLTSMYGSDYDGFVLVGSGDLGNVSRTGRSMMDCDATASSPDDLDSSVDVS